MDKLDRDLHNALKYFGNYTRAQVDEDRQRNRTRYKKAVLPDVEATLRAWGYLEKKAKTTYILNQNGLQQLRDLNEIAVKDSRLSIAQLAFGFSIVAIILTIIGFFVDYLLNL